MRSARASLCGLAAAWIAGCAATAPPPPSVAIPAVHAADPAAVATMSLDPSSAAQPDHTFAAGEVSAQRTITLAEVLSTAESEAAAVLVAAARLDAAAGRSQAATGALIPGVAAQFGAKRLDGRQVGSFGDVEDVEFDRFEPSIGLFYRVNPGAAVERSLAAGREAAAASLEIRDARRVAMLEASTAYFELVFALASLEIAHGLEADAMRFHEIAESRAALEVGPGSDVARAEVELSRARQVKLVQRARWEQASVTLATLLRWSPLVRLKPDGVVGDATSMDPTAHTTPTDAAEARPDLRAARA
ncbi:MAG: TolC family protein, partial [Myxococcales bacterium]